MLRVVARGVPVPACNQNLGMCPFHESPRLINLQIAYKNMEKSLTRPNSLDAFAAKTQELDNIAKKIAQEYERLAAIDKRNSNPSAKGLTDKKVEIFPGSPPAQVPVAASNTTSPTPPEPPASGADDNSYFSDTTIKVAKWVGGAFLLAAGSFAIYWAMKGGTTPVPALNNTPIAPSSGGIVAAAVKKAPKPYPVPNLSFLIRSGK